MQHEFRVRQHVCAIKEERASRYNSCRPGRVYPGVMVGSHLWLASPSNILSYLKWDTAGVSVFASIAIVHGGLINGYHNGFCLRDGIPKQGLRR